jgi:hypothetical protein
MKPLLQVYIDRSCELTGEAELDALGVGIVDVLRDVHRLNKGGVLLLGPRTSDGRPSLAALRSIRRVNPHLIVYLCTPWDREVLAQVARYTRAGMDRLFTIEMRADVEDLVRCVVQRAMAPPPAAAMTEIREFDLASEPLRLALHALRNSQHEESMEAVAERFGQALRTIEYCVSRADLPRMRDLYRCGRWLHKEELELCGVWSVTDQAARLGLGSPTSMRQWKSRLSAYCRTDERLCGSSPNAVLLTHHQRWLRFANLRARDSVQILLQAWASLSQGRRAELPSRICEAQHRQAFGRLTTTATLCVMNDH